jgi:hypothetical protein
LNLAELPIYRTGYSNGINLLDRTRSDWALSTTEKKRILINNIFGVDIDPQAVEVTKLSLLLKVLEGEKEENLDKQLKISDERALPSLHENIKCGNSLIGTDIITPEMSMEEVKRINPFDWDRAFPNVMKAGGFDAVIGNPPYVRQEGLYEQKKIFETNYTVFQGTADLYAYFIERGISLLKPGGYFSYIVANKWMRANYGKLLRQYLKTKQIIEILDFGALLVFKNATIYPCILCVANLPPNNEIRVSMIQTLEFADLGQYVENNSYLVKTSMLDDNGWSLSENHTQEIILKIKQGSLSLENYVNGQIYRGILTGFNKAFTIDEGVRHKLILEDPKSIELIKPFLIGKDIKRYQPANNDGKYIIFSRYGTKINNYPAILNHLKQFKTELTPKPKDWIGEKWKGRKQGNYQWFEIQDKIDYFEKFDQPKILWPGISSEVTAFSFDQNGLYGNDNTHMIFVNDLYLLGILNSKLTHLYLTNVCDIVQGGFYRLKISYIATIPIRTINFSDPADKARHDRMVDLVTKILDLNKKLQDAKIEHDKELLKRQIEATDAAIDVLVYELYGLTEEEIGIVEGK